MSEQQPIPTGVGESKSSIPPASNSILAVGVQGLERSVPEFHNSFLRQMGVKTGQEADLSLQTASRRILGQSFAPSGSQVERFDRGDIAFDKEHGVKVTVIKCAVGRTKKGTPIHRVVCRSTGDSWKVAESKLKRIE